MNKPSSKYTYTSPKKSQYSYSAAKKTKTLSSTQTKEHRMRDWSLDLLIGFLELRCHRIFAFVAYMCLKRSVPNWELPRWEKYTLFPGYAIMQMFFNKRPRKK